MLLRGWDILVFISEGFGGGGLMANVRNFNVDKIHLLKRMTLELKEIQTLQARSAVVHEGFEGLGAVCDLHYVDGSM